MQSPLQPSRACVALVKSFEGLRRTAGRLPGGGWTIGYGHTLSAREAAEVSEADAEALLIYDLRRTAEAVRPRLFAALTQNQFDALVAFAFNIGVEAFASSEVLKRVNEGDHLGAAYALERWRAAEFEGERLVIDALVRRRAAEKALYLTPPSGFPAAPTPVLRPLIDRRGDPEDARAGRAVELDAALDGDATLRRIDEAARGVTETLQARFPPAGETAAELAAEPAPFTAPQASDAAPLEETEPYGGPETEGLAPPTAPTEGKTAEADETSRDPSYLGPARAESAAAGAHVSEAPKPAAARGSASSRRGGGAGWIIGLTGLALFAFSVMHMLQTRATAANLIGGLAGAALLAYAAARASGRGRGPDEGREP